MNIVGQNFFIFVLLLTSSFFSFPIALRNQIQSSNTQIALLQQNQSSTFQLPLTNSKLEQLNRLQSFNIHIASTNSKVYLVFVLSLSPHPRSLPSSRPLADPSTFCPTLDSSHSPQPRQIPGPSTPGLPSSPCSICR